MQAPSQVVVLKPSGSNSTSISKVAPASYSGEGVAQGSEGHTSYSGVWYLWTNHGLRLPLPPRGLPGAVGPAVSLLGGAGARQRVYDETGGDAQAWLWPTAG